MKNEMLLQGDPDIAQILEKELDRQEYKLELIASENYVSENVMAVTGSVLTNKYAEGYPHKRYYGGCEYVDLAESLAQERARKLFGCEYVNVQPHSGSQANMAVYFSLLEPGDTIMGMDLTHGGHLTHGSPVNFSGRFYNVVSYGLNEKTERIDFDDIRTKAKKAKPKLIIAGASAYSRDINFQLFREIADEVGAYLMADIAHPAGLVAAGLHSHPFPHCHVVTTTTHKTLRGPRGGMILSSNEFEKKINKNIFPGIQGGPLMHVIAAKAVAFKEALQPSFKVYAENVIQNAKVFAASLKERNLRIVSDGTDNHCFLVDLTETGVSGKDAENALGEAGITVNKNTVPRESRSPFVTSGIRVGTPALTTRGMGTEEMKTIANWMADVIFDISNNDLKDKVKNEIKALCLQFPIYKK